MGSVKTAMLRILCHRACLVSCRGALQNVQKETGKVFCPCLSPDSRHVGASPADFVSGKDDSRIASAKVCPKERPQRDYIRHSLGTNMSK